jgi:hypothetical protein
MSASIDQLSASVDALEHRLLLEARKNGRLEFAQEVADWACANAHDLPPHIRSELAKLILKAAQ